MWVLVGAVAPGQRGEGQGGGRGGGGGGGWGGGRGGGDGGEEGAGREWERPVSLVNALLMTATGRELEIGEEELPVLYSLPSYK